MKAVAGSEDCCWWDECHRVEHAELGGINGINSRVSTTGIFTVVLLPIPSISSHFALHACTHITHTFPSPSSCNSDPGSLCRFFSPFPTTGMRHYSCREKN